MNRLLRGREHQLNSVKLIYLAGAGVIVHSCDICTGIRLFQRLDNALADYVVRQACKRLDADDVGCAGGQKLHHFTGEEPTLSILVAKR